MPPSPERGWLRRALVFGVFLALLLLVWEGLKFIGGDPWRTETWTWDPPLKIWFASDLLLPHVWDIFGALSNPVQRGTDQSLAGFLVGAAFYTWREAAIGFVVGAAIGIGLAALFVHSRLLERALVPYVIASQTIPIVALAPMIVFAFGQEVISVVIIATYLTFFPVTIAMIRGLRSPDPRAIELMRSYAASRWSVFWKLRMPASLPYLFTALKISATASIVGAIVGEGPGGIPDGLGRAIINFNSQYVSGPEKLWAAILACAVVGIAFFTIVRVAEVLTLRGRGIRPEVA
ncbi:MAG TPA: ABC transporter permease [Candidatus Limnocylindria bacterium]|nr:ABC transporter permease [Candidatus Limnocylindria bacterium]